MATLYVRDVPDDLYDRLRKRADERGTSISAEAVALLRRSLRTDRAAIRKFLDDSEKNPLRVPPGAPSPADLIREDRDAS
jgi:plasmid stability protein